MNTLYLGAMGDYLPFRDVGKPQAAVLLKDQCLLDSGQAIVSEGRTQAVDTLHWGRIAEQSVRPAPQKTRSRGCPRAQKQLSHFARLPLWLHALRKSQKLFMLKNLFRKSLSIPANTSNIGGRAFGAFCAVPALFLSGLIGPAPVNAPLNLGVAA